MLNKQLFRLLSAAALALCISLTAPLFAQGLVSAGISGAVVDEAGRGMAGVTVTAVHTPTNASFTAITAPTGRFSITGLPVGGPYTLSATASGVDVQSLSGVLTTLGTDTEVVLSAGKNVVVMEKFQVSSSTNDLDAAATGASSVLSNQRLMLQPTSNRSFADLMKTNAFVSIRAYPQVQALGMNNRFNSITLDGARINDQFGLSSSGLFSLNNPFSLDAVEQLSVSLTPYDVSQSGFAGASINAVSKSGTNEFHGSAAFTYTSYKWQGADVAGTTANTRPTSFYERTQSYTLGGPILKDRLFFFASYEKFVRPQGAPARPGFNPDSAVLSLLDTQIKALPGSPNLGIFGGAGITQDDDVKRMLKLDWRITNAHRMSVRYSDTKGTRPSFGSFNPGTGFSGPTVPNASTTGYSNGITSLSSSYYDLAVIEKVWAGQIFSNWTPDFKTQINYSQSTAENTRVIGALFPEIRILNVPGTSSATGAAVSTLDAISFGTEVSSQGNGQFHKTHSYSATADYRWKDFTFRGGFDHEDTDFFNIFRAGSYGVFAYNYSPTLNLATAAPLGFARAVTLTGFSPGDVSTYQQTGYFAQTKWEPTRRLNLTLGFRYDELGSPIAPPENADFKTKFGRTNAGTIDGTNRFAPRFGFNYALDEARRLQIRGGAGVFLGRNPWVWISNSYGSPGIGRYTLTSSATSPAPTLSSFLATDFDRANPSGIVQTAPAAGSAVSVINYITPGLKLPTLARGNLAFDLKLPLFGATFTVEYIQTKQLESLFIENNNLKVLNGDANNQPTAASYGADGRLRFGQNAAGNGGSGNVPYVAGYGNVIGIRNVRAGGSQYIAFTLDRPMREGWAATVSYTRGNATDAQPFGSSTANSQWGFNNVFNQGVVEEERSDYEIRDRVQISFVKEFNYFKRHKTTLSAYYEGRSGQPFSYVYSGDLNKDGNSSNDVVAVPTGLSDPRFDFSGLTAAEQAAYFKFINGSELSKYAGGYAPRNAFLSPWQNRLDLQVVQEVTAWRNVKVELFASFINFGAWLSKDFFNYVEEINASTSNSNQLRQLGNAQYNAAGLIRPTLTAVGGTTLDANGNIQFPSASVILPNNGDSRWRIAGGVRLKF